MRLPLSIVSQQAIGVKAMNLARQRGQCHQIPDTLADFAIAAHNHRANIDNVHIEDRIRTQMFGMAHKAAVRAAGIQNQMFRPNSERGCAQFRGSNMAGSLVFQPRNNAQQGRFSAA
eukprot:gene12664-12757_t